MTKLGKGLKDFYTKEELIKHFGHENPDISERTEHFKFLWFYFSEDKELDMSQVCGPLSKSESSKIRQHLGPFNCVVRGFRLRFRYEEDMLFIKLKYSDPERVAIYNNARRR